jgi:hypothetical protein
MRPEDQARENIDKLLSAAGWLVCDASTKISLVDQGAA